MELVRRLANLFYELQFNEVMDVLSIGFVHHLGIRLARFPNLLQAIDNPRQLCGIEDARFFQGPGPSSARRQFIAQQATIKAERALPLIELRIERFPEPSRPHFHERTPTVSPFFSSC